MIFPLYIPVLYPILWSKLWLLQMPWAIFLRKKTPPTAFQALLCHRSTRVSDDALETGKTGAVSCEPNDKYEDLKTQLLKSINVGKTTNVV